MVDGCSFGQKVHLILCLRMDTAVHGKGSFEIDQDKVDVKVFHAGSLNADHDGFLCLLSRCLITSYRTMAPDTEALKEETGPFIGMEKRRSHFF